MIKIHRYTFKDTATFNKYDKNTPFVFKKIKQLLITKIIDAHIEHIGSTAAKCAGKNIIDILVAHKKNISRDLLSLGFQKGKNQKNNARKIFVGSVFYRRKKYNTHIHVMDPSNKTVKNMILFRDFLIKHPEQKKKYELIKQKAIESGSIKNKQYNPSKAPLIESIIRPNKKTKRKI